MYLSTSSLALMQHAIFRVVKKCSSGRSGGVKVQYLPTNVEERKYEVAKNGNTQENISKLE